MTVRWKPLIVLSVLFCLVAVLGLTAVMFALPGDAKSILPMARRERAQGQFEKAELQYKRVIQLAPRDAKVHAEFAEFYAEWAESAPKNRHLLRVQRLHELAEAAKFDKRAVEPRRQLLADALRHEDPSEGFARDLLVLDENDPDAHFALAYSGLKAEPIDSAKVGEHMERLVAREPDRPRTIWVRAAVAHASRSEAEQAAALERSRSLRLDPKADATDQVALARLRTLDVLATRDAATLDARLAAFRADTDAVARAGVVPPERLTVIGKLIAEVQDHVESVGSHGPKNGRLNASVASLDKTADATFRKALEAAGSLEPQVYEEYAEHLLTRQQYAACYAVVAESLKKSWSNNAASAASAARLRELAVKAALSDTKDAGRYAKAEEHIKNLLASTTPRYQALGHLFQGVVDLDRSGLAEATRSPGGTEPKAVDPKRRASALEHLKTAATGLNDVATAQALYGVALLLSGEPSLGRQYLQNARKLPNLEPRYRLWAAWASVQAGYPEDAEPVVRLMLEAVSKGELPPEMEPTLHLLKGEIHQSRRTPADLKTAREEYRKAIASGLADSPALRFRMAQLDLVLDRKSGEKAVAALRADQTVGAAAEYLHIASLMNEKKYDEARTRLDAARRANPDNEQLLGLDAAMHMEDGKPEAADRVLAAFVRTHPNSADAIQLRARLLAGPLQKPDEARKLLAPLAESSESSGPLVELALIDLTRNDHEAAAKTIATIRSRWKESAAPDILEAQLALAKERLKEASNHLEEALRKDPGNKVALFWKAQIDDRQGASRQAEQAYLDILKANPVKEVDDGLSLTRAANWALATLALENQDADAAIERLQGLLREDPKGELERPVRWQLVAAYSTKGDWPRGRVEMERLLKDAKTTTLERVRAANFYRVNGEITRATAELDRALNERPDYSPAIAMRAFLTAQTRPVVAAALLRRAISASKQPESIFLMLAAVENLIPPSDQAVGRALAALEDGLKLYPDSVAMIQAKARVVELKDGPKAALDYVTKRAVDDPKGQVRRLLIDMHRQAGRYADAEALLTELAKRDPKDSTLAVNLVGLVAQQAIDAGVRGDREAEAKHEGRVASLIRTYRAAFPNETAFLQAECEMAARQGKFDQANSLTQQIDALDPNSPIGPTLRARIAAAQGAVPAMEREYAEAVSRAPRRPDLRLALGEASLAVGKTDQALKQAEWLLESNGNGSAAVLLKARALAGTKGNPKQAAEARTAAIRLLTDVLKTQPKFSAAYHLMSEIRSSAGERAGAIQALRDGVKAVPADTAGLSQLVQKLTEPTPDGKPAPAADRQEALALARKYGEADKSGRAALALAIGFHKSGRFEDALPWADKAADSLDDWLAHLNYGDLLLAQAESSSDSKASRTLFEKAVEEYDRVLKAQANSVEAVNNKAWILHEYLGRDQEALAAAEGLLKRVSPAVLPPDFHDTLGAIQESMSRPKDAERSYSEGLRKAPGHPVLNFHMARLVAADPTRAEGAVEYLRNALAGREALSPAMAKELDALAARIGK